MNNNDILRRLRYTFEFNDKSMIKTFAEGGLEPTREHISDWLKREDDLAYKECPDVMLAAFLNGLINLKRGKREGEQPAPEERLTNNNIFMKLKIALNLQAEDILEMMNRSAFRLSKHELSAFFRKADHKHFRKCQDQVLRHFLKGLQLTHRPGTETVDGEPEAFDPSVSENEAEQTANTASANAPEPTPSSPWASASRKAAPKAPAPKTTSAEIEAATTEPANTELANTELANAESANTELAETEVAKAPAAKPAIAKKPKTTKSNTVAPEAAVPEATAPEVVAPATDAAPTTETPEVESVWRRKKP
jgi:uncharacterized protein YehS (DUF1456 family)